MAPLILDKEEERDDTDDHGAGNADHNQQATVHLVGAFKIQIEKRRRIVLEIKSAHLFASIIVKTPTTTQPNIT